MLKHKVYIKKNTRKQHRLLTKTDVNIVNNIDYLQKPMSTCTLTSVIIENRCQRLHISIGYL